MTDNTPSAVQPFNDATAAPLPERLIRIAEVCRQTGISRSQVYRLAARGEFPRPIRLYGNKSTAWQESLVQTWIAERIAAARSE